MEPILFYYSLLVLVSLLQRAAGRVDGYGGWNNAPDTQYHIQTDEGEERYFKYQTKSGQYRKEKRLQDGTVVGTYGWVDPNGYLRLRDYIADNAGYRILKSRMLFVGDGSDIGNSVVVAKNVPATGGNLVSPSSSPFNSYSLTPTRSVYVPPTPTKQTYASQTPLNIYVPSIQSTTPASTYKLTNYQSTPAPVPFYSSTPTPAFYPSSPVNSYPTSTPSPVQFYSTPSTPSLQYYGSSTPLVDIFPNSAPKISLPVFVSTTLAPPVDSTPKAIAVYSSTPKPVAVNYVSSPPETATPAPTISAIGSTAAPPPEVRLPPISGKYASPVNNFITETEKNQLFFRNENRGGFYKKRFVDYRSNDQEYDGISTVQNGFRYFLPRMYHEEQSSRDGQDRVGSFGYVDPFGIRRVIYYNTSPGRGFVHRKNNRYVGQNAAPYDPRPA